MRNIVSIATYKRTGSGVIFECAVEKEACIPLGEDEKSYLILTNYHVIQDIDQRAGEEREVVKDDEPKFCPMNQKGFMDLVIKDINGEEIDSQYISYVTVQSGKNYDEANDVAAILVIIKDCCQIPCEKNVWIGTDGNRTIETQGYPHVFEQDTVSRELCMTGRMEKYNVNGMGLYKIQDDYHGYSDISDKELMNGLSGSPVYTKEEHQEYVIGINQSVCNIGDGKNPFKIVYFIEIGKALEWLRSQCIVLYEYDQKHIRFVWIYRFAKFPLDLEKAKRIILIGGSGVGKTSFYFLKNKEDFQNHDIENNQLHIFCQELFQSKFEVYFKQKENSVNVVTIETIGKPKEELKQVNEWNKKGLENEIENFYKKFYDEIINILRGKDFYQDGTSTFELAETTEEEKNWITRCLRKVGNDSLTSIVRKVEIEDLISNEYAYALNEQKVKSLLLYDTCGIDHVSRSSYRLQLQKLLDEIKSKRSSKKNRYKIDGVIYLKKLSSEKPTELETMLPIINQLDETIPVYCLFTAIDNYYFGKENLLGQIRWDKDQYDKWKVHKEGQECWFPKTIENMHENKGLSQKLDVPTSIQIKIWRFLVDHMYPYASHYTLEQDEIISMNRKTLVSIMRSILMEEWMLGFIWDMDKGDENENNHNAGNPDSERLGNVETMETKLKKALQKDLENMFQRASQKGWEYRHPSTVRANFRRIYRYDENYNKKHNEMGLNRMYIDRWDSLLEAGYRESFLSRGGKTIDTLVNVGFTESNAYNLVALMESEILDIDMREWHSSQEEKQESEFRRIFKEMYKSPEIYDVDVFELQRKNDVKYSTNYSKAEFLNIHCDFQKGLKAKGGYILEEFVGLFYKKLMDQLENRNKVNLQNLRKYDIKFKESLEYIKKVIQKYANGDLTDDEKISEQEVWKLLAKNLEEPQLCDIAADE